MDEFDYFQDTKNFSIEQKINYEKNIFSQLENHPETEEELIHLAQASVTLFEICRLFKINYDEQLQKKSQ